MVTPSIEYYKEVGKKFYQNITWKPEGKLGTIAMDIYTEVLISTDSLLRINCYLKNEKTQNYEFASEEKVNYQSFLLINKINYYYNYHYFSEDL